MPEGTEMNNQETPSIEELMERIVAAEERATQAESRASKAEEDSKRYKGANDKLSKENADYKRKSRANMDETEQRIAGLEEKLRSAEERAEQSERENSYNKALTAYKNIEDSKTIEELIEAVSDGDHSSIAKIMEKEIAKAVEAQRKTDDELLKKEKAEWQKTQTPANTGASGGEDGKSKAERLVEMARKNSNRSNSGNSILSHYI